MRRTLRTTLGLVMVAIGVVIVVVLILVLRNVNVTAEMTKEAREAVLLAEMNAAVQSIEVRADAWLGEDVPITAQAHPVLDVPETESALAIFSAAAGELRSIIKADEQFLVDDMSNLFAEYRTRLSEIHDARLVGSDSTGAEMAAAAVEHSFRKALLALQNEEIEHLAGSIESVSANGGVLRWLVPGLLALVLVLAFGLREVTDRSMRLEEAEALNRSRNDFIASVSHELRTPLSVVVGLSHELRDRLASFDSTEIEDFAGMIAQESDEVASIVDDLLVAARIESGQLAISTEDVEMQAEVDHVLALETSIGHLDVSVTSDGPVVASADRVRVRQILRNLLSNAARYGGGSVEVGMVSDGGRIRLWVADDGPGIGADDAERVFEPYERAHGVEGVPASVGLGLTVSRQLARAMGGDLIYRYEQGSRLELVLAEAERAPVAV
ncbi:MAG: HAMP domain-containing histidine kinase [Acidimicrobiia bacterium]|nr:HAMP domain-containing histidine kinase [Acidimicrobiia bacterium]